jgi:membrane-associated phospholipid phosphatase
MKKNRVKVGALGLIKRHYGASKTRMLTSFVGLIGVFTITTLFIIKPSFPTPDTLLVFLIFIFMIFNIAWGMFKRLGPLAIILIAYDSFKNLLPSIDKHVHYTLMPNFDTSVFGTLPTITLQKLLWHGHVVWYDYIFYGVYMMHFLLPIFLAIIIYEKRSTQYWRFATTYIVASFTAFIFYFLYPTAPPWLASQDHYIPHITRISNAIYESLGVNNFPAIYNRFAPNPVAAVPSLHAAFSVLFVLFVYKLFGKRWAALSLIYPFIIMVGVIYMGEHYAFDVLTGILLAIISFAFTPYLMKFIASKVSINQDTIERSFPFLAKLQKKYGF